MSEINDENTEKVNKVGRLSDEINDATKELEKLSKPTWFFSKRSLNTTIKITGLQNKIKELQKERLRLIRTVSLTTRRIKAGLPIEKSKPPVIPINHEAAAKRAAEIRANVARFQNIIKQAAAREAAKAAEKEAANKAAAKSATNPGSKFGGRRLTRSKRRAASTRRKRV